VSLTKLLLQPTVDPSDDWQSYPVLPQLTGNEDVYQIVKTDEMMTGIIVILPFENGLPGFRLPTEKPVTDGNRSQPGETGRF
jgi:hypothetical protein